MERDNKNLRKILAKGPKYRESQSINCKYNFKILMNSVEDSAKKWTKQEKEEVGILSEWVKAVRLLIRIRT